jgi:hypothetical protein
MKMHVIGKNLKVQSCWSINGSLSSRLVDSTLKV